MLDVIVTAFGLIVTLLVGLYTFFTWSYQHWEKKNIYFEKPVIPIGSYPIDTQEAFGTKVRRQYNAAKAAGSKDFGVFVLWKPTYVPIDRQLIRNILSVNFQSFTDRGVYHNKNSDPLSAHLFSLNSSEWRSLRTKLTPTFTSGKMKMMILTIVECGEQLKKSMDYLATLNKPIDIKDITGQFTTDVIGSCAFGIDCNSFENPNSDFIKYSTKVFQQTTYTKLKGFFSVCFPKLSKLIGLALTEEDISRFFLKVVKDTVEYRERNKIVRNDFMQLLINLKNEQSSDGYHMTLEEIAAQAYLFFIAGFETSSTTMMFFLYELSENQDVQEKVREEINSVLKKHDGKVTYEAIMEMKYTKQTIDETLRKYPPVPVLFRQSVEDYRLPETGQILEKGTSIFIPCIGLHYDEEYFPDPEKFDPDRFSEENKQKINSYSYLPFGDGPRNCIGLRFGIMQAKVGLIYLVKNFKFSLNEKTLSPLVMDAASFTLQPKGGIWLNAIKVE